jgi:hypothetical protein
MIVGCVAGMDPFYGGAIINGLVGSSDPLSSEKTTNGQGTIYGLKVGSKRNGGQAPLTNVNSNPAGNAASGASYFSTAAQCLVNVWNRW